jgi:hypothetical protein
MVRPLLLINLLVFFVLCFILIVYLTNNLSEFEILLLVTIYSGSIITSEHGGYYFPSRAN